MQSRWLYAIVVGAVILASLALRLADPAPVARLRALVFDTYQQLDPGTFNPALPIRIVDIDERSLKQLGQWPWPRTVLAKLVDELNKDGAAVIGFDMVFPEADRMSPGNVARYWPQTPDLDKLKSDLAGLPSNDHVFAQAISQAPVVLGFIALNDKAPPPERKAGFAHGGDDPALFVPSFTGDAASLPALQKAATGQGSVNWIPEQDQIIRRMPMLITVGGKLYPSFAAECLRVAQGASTYLVKSSGASGEQSFGSHTGVVEVKDGQFVVPTGADGQMWMRFSKHEPDLYLPAWKVLAGKIPASEINGRIILVGTSAAGLLDLRATPLDPAIPGVELHAQAIEQIISGHFLQRPDFATGAEALYILLLGLVIAFLIYRAGALTGAILGLVAIAAVIGVSWYGYAAKGWLIDPIYPSISLLAIYLTGTLVVFLRTEHERNRVRNAFSHYMAPALVERLAAEPSRLKLGGETRDMTLLFSDVRGFTTISEGLSAEELTQFLNSLFTPLSNIVLDEQGTIDKFMGDAVMAFWNAPLDDPAHANHACRAALRMMAEMKTLNQRWADEAAAKDRPFKPVSLGIGLNTGDCCVGNLGSETRFDYSVIGDNVNVASRLEGQSKTYGVGAVVGQSTVDRAPDFAFLELDLLKVKGKTEATRIFALLGDEAQKHDDQFIALRDCHARFLEAFRNRAWDEAEALSKEARKLDGDGLDHLYALYEERISAFRTSPPPSDWDGSAEALSK